MPNIESLIYWKQSQETQEALKLLAEEAHRAELELLDGTLTVSPVLEREYCRAIGYIAGLRFIDNLIKDYGDQHE